MSKKGWQSAIENALREKGFNRKGAKKTAKATMQKSAQAKERRESAPLHGKVKVIVKNGVRLIAE